MLAYFELIAFELTFIKPLIIPLRRRISFRSIWIMVILLYISKSSKAFVTYSGT